MKLINLNKGTCVKVMFRNGISIEGFVEQWEEPDDIRDMTSCILRTMDNASTYIIRQPMEDIMIVKVLHEVERDDQFNVDNSVPAVDEKTEQLAQEKKQLELNFKKVYERSGKEGELDVKSLADLREKINQTDRQIIANKLRQHHIAEPKGIQYGSPGFFKKQSSK